MQTEQLSDVSVDVLKDEADSASVAVRYIKKKPDSASAIVYVEQIDFSKIIQDLISDSRWSPDAAYKVCRQYRNYLFLLIKYPEKILPPSPLIKFFWRQHIVDTRQYFKDCQAVFGHYLHYYPYAQCAELREAFNETKRLYWQEFGDVLPIKEYRFRWLRKFFEVNRL